MLDARHVLQLSLLWLAWICAAQTPGTLATSQTKGWKS